VAESAVSKCAPEEPRYKLDLKDPGPCLVMNFNKKRSKLDGDGLCMANNSNVSLQGIEDVLKTLDDLKTYLNRAYAKEQWNGRGTWRNQLSLGIGEEKLDIVLYDESPEYDPDAEPAFKVCNTKGETVHVCTVKTDVRGTHVDLGEHGSFLLVGDKKFYSQPKGPATNDWVPQSDIL
jgi:hypothetical protein